MNANDSYDSAALRVGRVLRASTRGFDCGTHSRHIDERHDFGALVRANVSNSRDSWVVGLIYKVEIKDDQLISELVMGEAVPEAILRDQRNNRLIPVEIKVLSVGYVTPQAIVPSLPPRPPMSLADVFPCDDEEVRTFNQQMDYFRIVLGASEVPSDDLLAAALRRAALAYSPQQRRAFLEASGRRLARDLSHDMKRLAHLLALLEPLFVF